MSRNVAAVKRQSTAAYHRHAVLEAQGKISVKELGRDHTQKPALTLVQILSCRLADVVLIVAAKVSERLVPVYLRYFNHYSSPETAEDIFSAT